MRYVTLSSLALLLAFVAAGCGGKSGPTYTLSPTEKCLNAAGHKAYPVKDPILTGSGGNLEVDFGYGTESIYIVFGKNSSEANAIQNKAITQTEINEHIARATLLAGVTVDKNVFYYSDRGPLTVVGRQRDQFLSSLSSLARTQPWRNSSWARPSHSVSASTATAETPARALHRHWADLRLQPAEHGNDLVAVLRARRALRERSSWAERRSVRSPLVAAPASPTVMRTRSNAARSLRRVWHPGTRVGFVATVSSTPTCSAPFQFDVSSTGTLPYTQAGEVTVATGCSAVAPSVAKPPALHGPAVVGKRLVATRSDMEHNSDTGRLPMAAMQRGALRARSERQTSLALTPSAQDAGHTVRIVATATFGTGTLTSDSSEDRGSGMRRTS